MYVTKLPNGHWIPYDDKDYEENARFKVGSVIKIKRPRNYKHHKLAFAIMTKGWENQYRYELFEVYRKVIHIKAGYYDEVPNKHGEPYYIPQSISYETMSQDKFDKFYEDIVKVIAEDLGVTEYELLNEI